MLDLFIRHIREKNILDFNHHYLLAISGGLDSTVLAHLLHDAGLSFSMAHCNFGLRGEESDGDEAFVKGMACQLDVKVYVKNFETKSYGKKKGISTQMAARELRYNWFEEILNQEGLDGLVVAHHADDQLETVLLNLLRGTGIEGIYGMSDTREKIIRPLLPFSRASLEAYAAAQGYRWREDASNASVDYKRNYIRHQIIPHFQGFDPAALSLLQFSFDRVKDTAKAFFYLNEAWLENAIKVEDQYQYLEIAALNKAQGKKSLLFYWLRPYGFTFSQMEDVLSALEKLEPGKTFLSKDYLLNLDRSHLILGPGENGFSEAWIEESAIEVGIGKDNYELLVLKEGFQPPSSPHEAMLDRERLNFPLKIRQWESGDRFRPLGMRNFKKVSDVLVDLKMPLIHKRNVKVLCSGEDIVWVIGVRIDDRFKITSLTTSALYMKKTGDRRRQTDLDERIQKQKTSNFNRP